jgi:hypothetical protein
MASGLPPPPTRADSGDFAWTSWYNQLYTLLSTTGSISWALVDKAGSSIGDLVNKSHGLLTSVLGTGAYHVSSAEATNITALPAAATILTTGNYATNSIVDTTFKTKAGVPNTTDIPAGKWAIYKDTSGGTIKLYANDGGTIKAVELL